MNTPGVGIPTGPHGTAAQLPIPDMPASSQTLDHWLITAPIFHPLWSQYLLACQRLGDAPGFPRPHLQFPGATHELIVCTLDPDDGTHDLATLTGYIESGKKVKPLQPINIVHQFTATDDEMRQLCWYAVWGVLNGHLNPETADAPAQIREFWLTAMTKTLAHIRGEAHAR